MGVSTKMMFVNALSSLTILMAIMSVNASSSRLRPTWRINRFRHPTNGQLMSSIRTSCSVDSNYSIIKQLRMRGGDRLLGTYGMRHKMERSDGSGGDLVESVAECDDCDDECDYEYEYYEVDDNDDAERDEEIAATDADHDDDDAVSQHTPGDYEELQTAHEEVDEQVAEDSIFSFGDDDDDDDADNNDYLFTTPISEGKKRNTSPSQSTSKSVHLAESNVPRQSEEDDEEIHLFETPIPKKKRTNQSQTTRKAIQVSNAPVSLKWWWQNQKPMTDKRRRRPRRRRRPLTSRRRHVSSSRGTSFIPPPFYSGSLSSRAFDTRTFHGRSFYSDVLASLSAALGIVLHPVGNAIHSVSNAVASILSRYISMALSLIRNTLDFIWYGPVEGVMTTGIPSRDGGLSSFMTSGPVMLVVTSILVVAMLSAVITSRIPSSEKTFDHSSRERKIRRFYRNNGDDDGPSPSIEEELHFLNSEFDAANPTTKDRITKSIIATTNRLWPNSMHQKQPQQQRRRLSTKNDKRPKSRRGQRQFTIQSIQQWWKERPIQPSVSIIEPQHLRNEQQQQQQPLPLLGKTVHQLQKKLAASEQERAILRQDVQHLLTKLQKAQELAKSASLHNKWHEKLTSRTDQILEREREKVGGDEDGRQRKPRSLGKVSTRQTGGGVAGVGGEGGRTHDRGVLERSGGIGGRNDLDIQAGPNPRILDGVTIVREMNEMDVEGEDGVDDYYYYNDDDDNDDDDDGVSSDMKWPAL
jgi:hypothetical protein